MSEHELEIRLFGQNARHISNLRRVVNEKHFGMLLGAGISKPLHFPSWDDLIDKISKDPAIGRTLTRKAGDSHTSVSQMLFQHFRRQRIKHYNASVFPAHELELLIKADWRKIIHAKLYAKNPLRDGFLDKHPYLKELLLLVRESRVVINYNFDNLIEKGLLLTRPSTQKERGYDSTWRACIHTRADNPLIYHPNGFLPFNLLEGPSEDLVFSEDAFADQLIDSMAGHYSSLLHHLAQHTCLLLGISLADPTLKHLLRQHARMNPGHYHYYIAYRDSNERFNPQRAEAIREANFEVYNLITIFLDNKEIQRLLRLLTLAEEEILKIATSAGQPRKYVFYVTGVPGSGKSTTVANFSWLETHDEWVDERLPEMAREWTKLSSAETKKIDKWVAAQFGIRNYRACKSKEGILILDRCPLDPLTFGRPNLRKSKAMRLLKEMSGLDEKCLDGQVILLMSDPMELSLRAKSRHKEGDENYFRKMQEAAQNVYSGQGVVYMPTQGHPLARIIKRVARQIHFGSYEVFRCHTKLRKY